MQYEESKLIQKFLSEGILQNPLSLQDLKATLEELNFHPKLQQDYLEIEDSGKTYRIREDSSDFYLSYVDKNGIEETDGDKITAVYKSSSNAARLLAQVIKVNREVNDMAKALEIAQTRDPDTEEF